MLLFFTGCQTKDPVPLSVTKINTYAKPVLELSLNNILMFNTCKTLGSPILEEATSQYNQWLEVNNTIAQAADNFLRLHQTDYVKYNDTYYSLNAIKKVNDIQKTVLKNLNFKQRGPNGQKAICRREFVRANKTPLNSLQPTSAIGNALFSQSTTTLNDNYASVLDTAKDNIIAKKAGRSLYKVNSDMSRLCEKNLTLLTLKNTWPKESYAVYCQKKSLLIVQCNWGSCKQHEPTIYQP